MFEFSLDQVFSFCIGYQMHDSEPVLVHSASRISGSGVTAGLVHIWEEEGTWCYTTLVPDLESEYSTLEYPIRGHFTSDDFPKTIELLDSIHEDECRRREAREAPSLTLLSDLLLRTHEEKQLAWREHYKVEILQYYCFRAFTTVISTMIKISGMDIFEEEEKSICEELQRDCEKIQAMVEDFMAVLVNASYRKKFNRVEDKNTLPFFYSKSPEEIYNEISDYISDLCSPESVLRSEYEAEAFLVMYNDHIREYCSVIPVDKFAKIVIDSFKSKLTIEGFFCSCIGYKAVLDGYPRPQEVDEMGCLPDLIKEGLPNLLLCIQQEAPHSPQYVTVGSVQGEETSRVASSCESDAPVSLTDPRFFKFILEPSKTPSSSSVSKVVLEKNTNLPFYSKEPSSYTSVLPPKDLN